MFIAMAIPILCIAPGINLEFFSNHLRQSAAKLLDQTSLLLQDDFLDDGDDYEIRLDDSEMNLTLEDIDDMSVLTQDQRISAKARCGACLLEVSYFYNYE
jgi:hypothetical protein